MSLPDKIAILIPEFPGQTHSFFWREIEALREHHGVSAQIISTRLPALPVLHDWVRETHAIQLHPVPFAQMVRLGSALAIALPQLLRDPDTRRILRQPMGWALVLMALRLAQLCRAQGLKHIHVHSCGNSALVAAVCQRLSGIPYSLVLHGPLTDYGPEQPFKWDQAQFIFVITDNLRSEVRTMMPVMIKKVRVVPMGVNTDFFGPPTTPRPEYPDPFTWFCCARLNRVKGYDTLVAAAAELCRREPNLNFRIRIAGEDEQGGAGYRQELHRLIAEAKVSNVVQLLGSITQDAVRQELQAADAFVLPSLHEPLGVAYMEAMACNLPVIGTDAGGVRELITEDCDGILVAPGDPRVLAGAMAGLMRDSALRQTLGSAARQKILRNFSSRRSADALAEALSRQEESIGRR